MRQPRTVPSSMAAWLISAILAAAVMVPFNGAGTAAAAPASLVTAFRDLPLSVRTGDIMKVQVDAPNGVICDGAVSYRDNSVQKLKEQKEADGRCRWDLVVPDVSRRGEADVTVTIKDESGQVTISATVDVVRRADTVGIELRELPRTTKREGKYTIQLDVPDGSTCSGIVTYADGKTQGLESQAEYKDRCQWDPTVGVDVTRGTALVQLTISQEGRTTTLATSFAVEKDTDGAKVLAAFQDLPTTIRRDSTLPIRVLVPSGARCEGDVRFRSADNVTLEQIHEQNGVCRWSMIVPDDAKRGETRVKVTVKANGDDNTIDASTDVIEGTSDVDASFKDLPSSIRRGDDLDVRVSVPDGASCHGDVIFDDGAVYPLDSKAEKKDRCFWSLRVPTYTPRGMAVVRVWIDDQGVQTRLIGNVTVEGSNAEPVASAWNAVPTEAHHGQEIELSVNVASGASCSGRIDFVNGMRWTLGTTASSDFRCRWRVQVPNHVGLGKATIEIKIENGSGPDELTAELEIKAS